jgi:hypothetical protein
MLRACVHALEAAGAAFPVDNRLFLLHYNRVFRPVFHLGNTICTFFGNRERPGIMLGPLPLRWGTAHSKVLDRTAKTRS